MKPPENWASFIEWKAQLIQRIQETRPGFQLHHLRWI